MEAEQMPVARIDDRRKLFVKDPSCNVVTCHYPYYFNFEQCDCVPTFKNCAEPQMTCDAGKEWSEKDCNCVHKSKYCSHQLQCNLPLVWSWGHCSCMHPDDMCKNTMRCPAWKVWDADRCWCAPKFHLGK